MGAVALVPGEEELDLQRQCTRCGEWWPAADEEFWFRNHGGWHPHCRACHRESRDARRPAGKRPPDPNARAVY